MKGSCLCNAVTYEIKPPFKVFQYCHCSRCRKFTGSAHAANIFVPPGQFKWLTGEAHVQRYEIPESKYFATCFCKNCGSSLPWAVKGGNNIVVPAGTLDEDPGLRPQHNIFWADKACWYESAGNLKQFNQLPVK